MFQAICFFFFFFLQSIELTRDISLDSDYNGADLTIQHHENTSMQIQNIFTTVKIENSS